ncbi:hypothetical protein CVT24_000717 [Panaeolus cyanescens]|uniref:Uncharacterized protein n=1 Tax=Panaeolus cyanescens TaxID=181874 RepID=A0A409YT45_9AGAR|nr:hypothetical protein CVT24_000717 [Panaeolus cyanescens]
MRFTLISFILTAVLSGIAALPVDTLNPVPHSQWPDLQLYGRTQTALVQSTGQQSKAVSKQARPSTSGNQDPTSATDATKGDSKGNKGKGASVCPTPPKTANKAPKKVTSTSTENKRDFESLYARYIPEPSMLTSDPTINPYSRKPEAQQLLGNCGYVYQDPCSFNQLIKSYSNEALARRDIAILMISGEFLWWGYLINHITHTDGSEHKTYFVYLQKKRGQPIDKLQHYADLERTDQARLLTLWRAINQAVHHKIVYYLGLGLQHPALRVQSILIVARSDTDVSVEFVGWCGASINPYGPIQMLPSQIEAMRDQALRP